MDSPGGERVVFAVLGPEEKRLNQTLDGERAAEDAFLKPQ